MIIAVNMRLQKNQQPEGYGDFVPELFNRLAKKYPQHQFIYIFDKPYNEKLIFGENVLPVIAGPQTVNSLRLQYWFNFKIPKILRQHKADVFVSPEGICSVRTRKPQCMIINGSGFLRPPLTAKKWVAGFYKKFTALFLAKAKSILAVSEFARSEIINLYKIPADKIELIYPAVDENFKPLDWEEIENIRENYADGKAYFLFSGDINQQSNYINLLKAFSFFKKRQKSTMLLLFAGKADEQFIKDLQTYKYRDEVKLLNNLSTAELAKITAAAYAMVYPVINSDLVISPLQAMQCHIPVIASDAGALPTICADAALYCKPEDFNDIAQNMMLVFKDEGKAKELVSAGKKQVKKHNWNKAAELLMQSIQKSFNS